MSVIGSPSTHASSLSRFLAESGSSAASPTEPGSAERFAGALEQALSGLGYQPGQVRISAAPGEAASATGALNPQSFVITLSPEPATGAGDLPAGVAAVEEPADPTSGYDPTRGPKITKDMWTEELLTGDLPMEVFLDVQDKADLLKARAARATEPTPAEVVSSIDGSATGLNSAFLSTRQQAEAMRERLIALGVDPGELTEISLDGGPFSTDWGAEDRRMYMLGTFNVGLLSRRYVQFTKEQADDMILAQFNRG